KGMSLAEKVFGAVETVEGVAQRLNAKIMGSVQPMAEKAAVSAQNERRAKELRETLAQQQKRLQALQGVSLDIKNYCTLRLLFNQSLVLDKVPEYGKPAKCCSP
ncbi:TPA: hypothetical protein ACHFZ1_005626, partial [Escherichia coli]